MLVWFQPSTFTVHFSIHQQITAQPRIFPHLFGQDRFTLPAGSHYERVRFYFVIKKHNSAPKEVLL